MQGVGDFGPGREMIFLKRDAEPQPTNSVSFLSCGYFIETGVASAIQYHSICEIRMICNLKFSFNIEMALNLGSFVDL